MVYIIENMTISMSEERKTRESAHTLDPEQSTFLSSHNPGWIEKEWLVKRINRVISTIVDIDTRRKLENMRTDIMER